VMTSGSMDTAVGVEPVPDFVAAYAAGLYMMVQPADWCVVVRALRAAGLGDFRPEALAVAAAVWAASHLEIDVLARRPLWPEGSPTGPRSEPAAAGTAVATGNPQTLRVLEDLEAELQATLSEFDDEAVGLAVLGAVERARARSAGGGCGESDVHAPAAAEDGPDEAARLHAAASTDERADLRAVAHTALRAGRAALRGWNRVEPGAEAIRRLRRELGAVAMVIASHEGPNS
jgi:hypothetical protein